SKETRRRVEGNGRCCGSQNRDRVEPEHPVGIVKALEKSCEKPKREQLEKRGPDTDVDQAVGQRPPDRSVNKSRRIEGERGENLVCPERPRQAEDQQHKISGKVDENQPARGALEIGEGEGTGAEAGHL